jgi:hypothetical protein
MTVTIHSSRIMILSLKPARGRNLEEIVSRTAGNFLAVSIHFEAFRAKVDITAAFAPKPLPFEVQCLAVVAENALIDRCIFIIDI